MPTPFLILTPNDKFTVVAIPDHFDAERVEGWEQEGWVDLIWTDVTLDQYRMICRGMLPQDATHEQHFFFKPEVSVQSLIKWVKRKILAQHTAGVRRRAVSNKISDAIDCEDILGGTVTQDGGFCADLNKKPGKPQYVEKAAGFRRRTPR
jgi:hypothetical protein